MTVAHLSRGTGGPTWRRRIRDALDHDRLVLYAQPILDLRTDQISRYELLLRMIDDDGHAISPANFLPTAERLGMITEIDRWVTGQAILLLSAGARSGRSLTLEVNLSGLSLGDPRLLSDIERDLQLHPEVDANGLIFEVTETAAVADIDNARDFVQRLATLGCQFALDDFGAGFGSLYYLKHLPFDYLKIDGEFIAQCATNRTDRQIIKATVSLANGLGKHTIAEYVQDTPTLDILRGLGVDYAQGYLIGTPQPVVKGHPVHVDKRSRSKPVMHAPPHPGL